jgi:hypothetical protein
MKVYRQNVDGFSWYETGFQVIALWPSVKKGKRVEW